MIDTQKEKTFLITQELGRLAKWLRIFGYDSVYYRKNDVSGIVITCLREDRILLTRNKALTKYIGVRKFFITKDKVEDQLYEIFKKFSLPVTENNIFTRCVGCNSSLETINREAVKDKVPSYVYQTQEDFKMCPSCQKIFWKGTHWDLAHRFLRERILR